VTSDPTDRSLSQGGTYTWVIDETQSIAPLPGLWARINAERSRRSSVIGSGSQDYGQLCRELRVKPYAVGHGLPARINPLDVGKPGKEKP
jgi:hypothetical protein